MVSNGQLIGMILAIVVPVMTGILLFVHIRKELKVKGLLFTACYGIVGYIWQAWIYVMVYGWVGAMMMQNPWFEAGIGDIVKQMIIAACYALMAAAGLYWAVYLANMREARVERGITVGLGFGLAYSVWNYFLVYGAPLIIGFSMRFGTYEGPEETKQRVLGLPAGNMYLFLLECILFMLILTATTLVMGQYHQQVRRLRMFGVVFLSQFLIKFFNSFLPTILPDAVSLVVYHILLGTAALYSFWIVMKYLKTGQVMYAPGKIVGETALRSTKSSSGKTKTKRSKNAAPADFTYAGNKKKKK